MKANTKSYLVDPLVSMNTPSCSSWWVCTQRDMVCNVLNMPDSKHATHWLILQYSYRLNRLHPSVLMQNPLHSTPNTCYIRHSLGKNRLRESNEDCYRILFSTNGTIPREHAIFTPLPQTIYEYIILLPFLFLSYTLLTPLSCQLRHPLFLRYFLLIL